MSSSGYLGVNCSDYGVVSEITNFGNGLILCPSTSDCALPVDRYISADIYLLDLADATTYLNAQGATTYGSDIYVPSAYIGDSGFDSAVSAAEANGWTVTGV